MIRGEENVRLEAERCHGMETKEWIAGRRVAPSGIIIILIKTVNRDWEADYLGRRFRTTSPSCSWYLSWLLEEKW